MLARYGTIDAIPDDADAWDITVRGRERLAATLAADRELAMRFRDLATLRTTADVFTHVDELRWDGPTSQLEAFAARVGDPRLVARAQAAAARER
ncbi:MAG TPA: hypothetical protein QF624_08705 [Dehalococcoidia bacterium]|nr:hypothetical protein [Dehalococcoidia bacterium]